MYTFIFFAIILHVSISFQLSLLPVKSFAKLRPQTLSCKADVDSSIPTLVELDVGDFQNLKFQKILDVSAENRIGKYRLDATIKAADFNEYLNAYKGELKRRKVVFPGFRPGNLPPYAMPDVRKYLICFGLETLLGQLCNINSLQMKTESGEEVPFGEDVYYDQIIQIDSQGKDFYQQRDAWREGNDYSFVAEFHAIAENKSAE